MATRLKIGGTQVDATPRTSGTTGSTTGSTTGTTTGTGGGGSGGSGTGGGPGFFVTKGAVAAPSAVLPVPTAPALNEWTAIGNPIDLPETRFASTHFAVGAIPILPETDWNLVKNGAVVGSRTISVTLTVNAYNRVLAWKFTREGNGTQLTEPWLSIRDAVMTFGASAYTTANYSEEPLALGTHLINKNQIADHPGKVTSLFGDTHGTATGAQDSGVAPGSSGQNALWVNLADGVPRPIWNSTVHPLGLALAAIYGCDTLPSQEIAAMSWRKENGVIVNSVYAGFSETIWGRYWRVPFDQSTAVIYDLDEHSEAFFNALAAGKTVEGARLAANDTVSLAFPERYNQPKPLMTLYGDPFMTLSDVYLTAGERTALGLQAHQASGHWYYPWTTP